VLLSTLLQDILNPSHHLLNVFLQIANKLGIKKKKKAKPRFGEAISQKLSVLSPIVTSLLVTLMKITWWRVVWHRTHCFYLGSGRALFILKMEAATVFKTCVFICQSTWCQIPDNNHFIPNLWVSRLCPSSGILNDKCYTLVMSVIHHRQNPFRILHNQRHGKLKSRSHKDELMAAFNVSKPSPITGRWGLWGCEKLRIAQYLNNRLTDGWVNPSAPSAAGRIR
jgi:hypothetical protein